MFCLEHIIKSSFHPEKLVKGRDFLAENMKKWEDDMIAYGVLDKLQVEGRVKNNQPGRGPDRWQLTEKEFEKRRDD